MAWVRSLRAVVAAGSARVVWVAVFGVLITAVSIVLQYIDSKPFDRKTGASRFVHVAPGEWHYQELSWLTNGRVSVNVYRVEANGTWLRFASLTGSAPSVAFG